MIQEYIHTPPPDQRWYIVYPSDMSEPPAYGHLTDTACALGHNYDTEEIFEFKAVWIARLLELGIEYTEGEE